MTSARLADGVRFGELFGRLDRSNSPSAPSAKKRSRHLRTVFASIWNRCAVASIVQPRSMTQATILRRPFGVNDAFRTFETLDEAPGPLRRVAFRHVYGGPAPIEEKRPAPAALAGNKLRYDAAGTPEVGGNGRLVGRMETV